MTDEQDQKETQDEETREAMGRILSALESPSFPWEVIHEAAGVRVA